MPGISAYNLLGFPNPASHRSSSSGGGSRSTYGGGGCGGGGGGGGSYRLSEDHPDWMAEDQAQRHADEIARDFGRLVANRKVLASLEKSDYSKNVEDHELLRNLQETESALLANLKSNWQSLRTSARKNMRIPDFRLLAMGYLDRDKNPTTQTPQHSSSSSSEKEKDKSIASDLEKLDLSPESTPLSDPIELLEQMTMVQNEQMDAWKIERDRRNELYRLPADRKTNPSKDNTSNTVTPPPPPPESGPMYYQLEDFYRERCYFFKNHPSVPHESYILGNLRCRMEVIEYLNDQHFDLEDYEANVYPALWAERVAAKGYAQVWREIMDDYEEKRALDNKWLQKERERQLESDRDRYKYAGITTPLRVKLCGYPKHLRTEEEKERARQSILGMIMGAMQGKKKKKKKSEGEAASGTSASSKR